MREKVTVGSRRYATQIMELKWNWKSKFDKIDISLIQRGVFSYPDQAINL